MPWRHTACRSPPRRPGGSVSLLDLKPWQVESWMTSHDPEFWAKASDLVVSTSIRRPMPWCGASMRSRGRRPSLRSTRPSRLSRASPSTSQFEYKRNGTAVLFAALDVHDGGIAACVTDSTKSENFVDFLVTCVRQTPKGSTCTASPTTSVRTNPGVATFLEKNPHVHIHFTPTHASWLNQSSCSFRSSSADSCAEASSHPSRIWPIASSPSSRLQQKSAPFR